MNEGGSFREGVGDDLPHIGEVPVGHVSSLRCASWTSPFREATIPPANGCGTWLEDNPNPTPRQLAESGYVAPHWPTPWGLSADPVSQLVIDDELRRAGVRRPQNQIGIGWAGPTLIHAGTDAQKERYLLPLLAAEEIWCQLFSEPGAGSDLAGLSTRAVADGDEWVVTGQKVWTTLRPSRPRSASCWRVPTSTCPSTKASRTSSAPWTRPGVTIRPIVDMTGDHAFNEVFFDDVRLPAANVVGRGQPRLVARQGDPRQRAGVVVG